MFLFAERKGVFMKKWILYYLIFTTMQYVSAVALASLSGKAPSKASLIQLRTQLSPSLRPLARRSMSLRLMPSSRLSIIERSMR